jgi:hypothetical protein
MSVQNRPVAGAAKTRTCMLHHSLSETTIETSKEAKRSGKPSASGTNTNRNRKPARTLTTRVVRGTGTGNIPKSSGSIEHDSRPASPATSDGTMSTLVDKELWGDKQRQQSGPGKGGLPAPKAKESR